MDYVYQSINIFYYELYCDVRLIFKSRRYSKLVVIHPDGSITQNTFYIQDMFVICTFGTVYVPTAIRDVASLPFFDTKYQKVTILNIYHIYICYSGARVKMTDLS